MLQRGDVTRMNRQNYYYIVVSILDRKYFYGNNSNFTNTFSDVMRFDTHKQAEECIKKNLLNEIGTEIIECINDKRAGD